MSANNEQPTQVAPYSFEDQVKIALKEKGVTAYCAGCAVPDTWDEWNIVPSPAAQPIFGANPIPCAIS